MNFEEFSQTWSQEYLDKIDQYLEKNIFPELEEPIRLRLTDKQQKEIAMRCPRHKGSNIAHTVFLIRKKPLEDIAIERHYKCKNCMATIIHLLPLSDDTTADIIPLGRVIGERWIVY